MSEKLPVSVCILTWNSGRTLRKALESVRSCAEILVIDGGSTDDTLKITAEFGARFVSQPETGKPIADFSAARNRGLEAATHRWILSLDSDEFVSEELLRDIERTVAAGVPCACLIPRRYVLDDGTIIRHATTYPNERLYFFHRDAVTRWIKPVHERPELTSRVPIMHFQGASLAPLGTIDDYKRKNMRYLMIEIMKAKQETLGHWCRYRLLRTMRSRLIATARLLWIWCIPRSGKRLPLGQEMIRFWYAWRLLLLTFPRRRSTFST